MTTTTLTPTIHTDPSHTAPSHTDPSRTAPIQIAPIRIVKGWHPDPMQIHKLRWHDGAEWTEHVTHFGPVPCHHCGR